MIGPGADIVGLSPDIQGSAWLTRVDGLSHAFSTPPITLVGVESGRQLDSLSDLQVFPAFLDQVSEVTIGIDDCSEQTLEAPFVLSAAGAVWSECLSTGEHEIRVKVSYDGLPESSLNVSFGWVGREEAITWVEHIEPIYQRYCAHTNCHVGAFEPHDYESFSEKIDNIILRTSRDVGESGRMPPVGEAPTETELLLFQWWRDDGTLLE